MSYPQQPDPYELPATRQFNESVSGPYPPQQYPTSPVPYGYAQPPFVQQVVVSPAPPTSGWAVTSLVFGILGVLGGFCLLGIPCIIAVVCGHAGLIDARSGKGGRGLALAGLVMGYLFVAPAIIVIAMGGLGAVLPASTSP